MICVKSKESRSIVNIASTTVSTLLVLMILGNVALARVMPFCGNDMKSGFCWLVNCPHYEREGGSRSNRVSKNEASVVCVESESRLADYKENV